MYFIKKKLLLLFFFVLLSQPLYANHHQAFQVGEQLHYVVHWTIFKAGYAYMRIPRKIMYRQRECLVLQSGARSTGFLGRLFRVQDRTISYWDPVARHTLFGKKDLREGNYFRHTTADFVPARRLVKWKLRVFSGNTNEMGKKKKGAKWRSKQGIHEDLPVRVHDVLSAVYYNRSHPKQPKPGDVFYIDVFDDGKLINLKMEILRRETITLKLNGKKKKLAAVVVRPHITTTGILRTKKKALVWISDDRRRWPLLIQAEAPVLGSIYVRLYRTVNTTPE